MRGDTRRGRGIGEGKWGRLEYPPRRRVHVHVPVAEKAAKDDAGDAGGLERCDVLEHDLDLGLGIDEGSGAGADHALE
jgi:hypothetical protein